MDMSPWHWMDYFKYLVLLFCKHLVKFLVTVIKIAEKGSYPIVKHFRNFRNDKKTVT